MPLQDIKALNSEPDKTLPEPDIPYSEKIAFIIMHYKTALSAPKIAPVFIS